MSIIVMLAVESRAMARKSFIARTYSANSWFSVSIRQLGFAHLQHPLSDG
jgi:hypothetical protein